MKEVILHTTTPKARKEHVCQLCGKPIRKGDMYLNIAYKLGRKVLNRKTHFGCRENDKKSGMSNVSRTPITEAQFKRKIHSDTLTMLETFTFQENMNISFVPLIITEVAWRYAEDVIKYAAENRISETIKLSRSVRELREKYISECKKDIDNNHVERLKRTADEYIRKNQRDLVLLYYSMNGELKKTWPTCSHLSMKTNACIALVFLRLLEIHNNNMNDLIASKLDSYVPSVTNPINETLKEYMKKFASPCEVAFEGHIETSMKILQKRFGLITFN